MNTTIYYNPRCSKCRQTLALISEKGIEPEIVPYLENPPTRAVLNDLLKKLGTDPRELIRFKDERARELGLKPTDTRPKSEWVSLLAENPELLQRPIVVRGDRAVISRPPELVLGIL
jgi:arsenate reductase